MEENGQSPIESRADGRSPLDGSEPDASQFATDNPGRHTLGSNQSPGGPVPADPIKGHRGHKIMPVQQSSETGAQDTDGHNLASTGPAKVPHRPGNQQDFQEELPASSEREFFEKDHGFADEKKKAKVVHFDLSGEKSNKQASPGKKKNTTGTDFGKTADEIERDKSGLFYCHGEVDQHGRPKPFRFSKTSLFCLSDQNALRRAFVWLATWKWFDGFITLAIILNSFMLASTDYQIRLDPDYESAWTPTQEKIDLGFSIVFIIEATVKIIAMGFVLHTYSYLREAWNCLDFFIVCVSIVGMVPGGAGGQLKILRTFRILRPLRSVNKLPEVKKQINSVLSSIPGLFRVFFFIIFIFSVFAIFGTNQFLGQTYQFCRDGPDATLDKDGNFIEWAKLVDDAGSPMLCSTDSDCLKAYPDKGEDAICGTVFDEFGKDPVEYDDIRNIELIQYGIVGFDNVAQGYLTIFQILTLESWVYLMYNYSDAGSGPISVIFFIVTVLLGAFFTMNLVLATVVDAFSEAAAAQKLAVAEQQEEEEEKRRADEPVASRSKSEASHSQVQSRDDDSLKVQEERKQVAGAHLHPSLSEVDGKVLALEGVDERNGSGGAFLPQISSTKQNEGAARAHIQIERNAVDGHMLSQESGQHDQVQDENALQENAPTTDKGRVGTAAVKVDQDQAQDRPIVQEMGFERGEVQVEGEQESDSSDRHNPANDWSEYEEEDHEQDARQRSRRNRCYRCTYLLVTSVAFNFTIFLLILANTATLACYTYDESETQAFVLSVFNEIFTWSFTLEMILKLIGLGFDNYRRDNYNVFDAVIVVISLVDWTISILEVDAGSALQAFRAMRLLRMMKLSKSWKALSNILVTTGKSLRDISQFSILLILFMYIFALLGMELFANIALEDENGDLIYGEDKVQELFRSGDYYAFPRDNWNNVGYALTTVFILIIGEDWNWTMYTWVRAFGNGSTASEVLAILFFVFIMIIGNIVLFSVFTAILLQNFEGGDDEGGEGAEDSEEEDDAIPGANDADGQARLPFCQRLFGAQQREKYLQSFHTSFGGKKLREKVDASKVGPEADPFKEEEGLPPLQQQASAQRLNIDESVSVKSDLNIDGLDLDEEQKEELQRKKSIRKRRLLHRTQSQLIHYDTANSQIQRVASFKQAEPTDEPARLSELSGKSLFCLGPENAFRVMCHKLVENKWFANIILVLIILSTITLALETPLDDPKGEKLRVLGHIDFFMTLAFTFEALVKIIAAGFLFAGKTSYIREPWNILDFLIVVAALLGILAGDAIDLSFLKALRILKILRPLRIIARNKGLKVAIMSLGGSIPAILSLQIIVLFFVFLFAILQTTIFSGQFFYCETQHTGLSAKQIDESIVTMWDCYNYGGEWVEPRLNFDNTLASMLTLLTIQTTEGWTGVLWASVDAVAPYQQPQTGSNPLMVVYTMILIIFICMLFMELFVGVVIETFNGQQELLNGNGSLGRRQFSWITVQLLAMRAKPQRKLEAEGTNAWIRNWCIRLTEHRYFDVFIMCCILANTGVLACNWYMRPESLEGPIEIINYVFMATFTIEAIVKIIAQKCNYFRDAWNLFDFTVVVGTLIILSLSWAGVGESIAILGTILRTLRIGRVFRLIKKQQKLQHIFKTLMSALPAMGSIAALLMLLIFMFAIIGMSQFALIDLDGADEMGPHVNFQTFGAAFLTLIRCSTGEAWNAIMFESSRPYSVLYQCNEDEDYDSIVADGRDPEDTFGPKGCGTDFAIAFHLLFQIIVSQVFLNLFIAIIIEAFFGQAAAGALFEKFEERTFEGFQRGWAEHDKTATGFITTEQLEKLIVGLASEKYDAASNLVLDRKLVATDTAFRERYIMGLAVPTYQKMRKVMFHDVLIKMSQSIVRNHYQVTAKKKMRRSLSKLMASNNLGPDSEYFKAELDNQFKAIKKSPYEQEIAQISDELIKEKNPRAELVRDLAEANKRLSHKYNHLVDTNVKMLGEEYFQNKVAQGYDIPIEIYSTAHSRSCKVIYKLFDQYLERRQQLREGGSHEESSARLFIRSDQ